MNCRNLGKFYIHTGLIRENPDEVAQIFKMLNLVVVRAECLFAFEKIEYMGLSDQFDEVELGAEAPTYTMAISSEIDDETEEQIIVSVEAIKQ